MSTLHEHDARVHARAFQGAALCEQLQRRRIQRPHRTTLIRRKSPRSLTGYRVDLSSKRRSCGSSPSRVIGRSKAGQRQNLRRRNAPRSRGYSTRQAESVITPSESLKYDAEIG